jgi:hypothetical protein
MNAQNTEKIFNEFSFFKPDRPMTESLMCFGFECGDGWFELIYNLCERIEQIGYPIDFEVVQVKEKFGGLRFYVHNGTDEIYKLISEAEAISYKTCEQCGAPASETQDTHGWISTLCEKCKATR